MLKSIKYLSVIVFLGLVVMLYLKLTANEEETKGDILRAMQKSAGSLNLKELGRPLPVMKPPTNMEIRDIFRRSPPKNQTFPGPAGALKLSGIIFDASHLSAAFIINPATGSEGVYYEGDQLTAGTTNWTIKRIEKKQVILTTSAGEELVLSLTPDVTAAASGVINSQPSVKINPDEFTGYKIDPRLIMALPDDKVTQEIKNLVKGFPDEFIYQKIAEFTDISQTEISHTVKLEDYATKLILAVHGGNFAGGGEKIIFGTEIKPDNTPVNPSLVFHPQKDRRIYASFANEGALKGLSKVVTRWTNTSDRTIVYVGKTSLTPTSANNYIYVEKKKGWSKGVYLVELFRVDTMEKIAQGRFEIKD